MNGKAFVLAARKAGYTGEPLAGVSEGSCSVCGHVVLLSRSGRDRIRRGFVPICSECVLPVLFGLDPTSVTIEVPTPAEWLDSLGAMEKN